jgi:hypothetical protein
VCVDFRCHSLQEKFVCDFDHHSLCIEINNRLFFEHSHRSSLAGKLITLPDFVSDMADS